MRETELIQDANCTIQICPLIPSIPQYVEYIRSLSTLLTLLNAVNSVKEPGRHVEEGGDKDPGDHLPGPGNGAEMSGLAGLADVDIALDSQDQSQPDRGVVEKLRSSFHK